MESLVATVSWSSGLYPEAPELSFLNQRIKWRLEKKQKCIESERVSVPLLNFRLHKTRTHPGGFGVTWGHTWGNSVQWNQP